MLFLADAQRFAACRWGGKRSQNFDFKTDPSKNHF